MKQNNNTVAHVHGTIDFFRYLQERPSERFSRFEAYIYMLDKACAQYRPANIEKKWIPAIGDGQFFTTKTELAADWHWHRATVRDFLTKLTEFGCLVVDEHLKGILCTMPRLVVTFNNSVAVAYNFDSMAKYMMYSWADGKLKPHQVERLCGQIERSAKVMLTGDLLSPYAEKQLEDTTKMIIHYAVEAIIAHHPGDMAVTKEIGCSSLMVEKRLLEFFRGHLAGNWQSLLTLLYKRTELALEAIVSTIQMGITSRAEVFERLKLEVDGLMNNAAPTDSDDGNPAVETPSSSTANSGTSPSDNASESDSDALAASKSSQAD